MALKYLMPTVGDGTRESPLAPKHPDDRIWNPVYFLDGGVEVVVRGNETPEWVSDPEVKFLGEVEDPK